MTTTTYPVRLLGGRNLGVVYDAGAGTLSIMGASIALNTLPSSLQTLWTDAIATVSTSVQLDGKAAFGGSNLDAVVGEILDATPTWSRAVQAAVENYVAMVTHDGLVGDPESAIWGI